MWMEPDHMLIPDKRSLRSAVNDVSRSAKIVNLVYVNDKQPGITRVRKGDTFIYTDDKKKIQDPEILERIQKLAIPPAWENVWICKLANGHLQATGTDTLNRKQYKYHNRWSAVRNHTKFYRLIDFGKQLPGIRATIQKHLSLPGYPREKVLAIVVSLLEQTNIRIGNSAYEKLYGSFGLTTLKNKHVDVNGIQMNFSFKGKKGIHHRISLRSKKLAKLVQGCKDIPGKELFQYIDENGIVQNVDSGMVNEYIQEISGGEFTAKDFRTWTGSVQALIAFNEAGPFENNTEMKQKIAAVLDVVASHLGNTRAVCKKYYVHPEVVKLYEENNLEKIIAAASSNAAENTAGLAPEEKLLLKILALKKRT